MTLIQFDEHGNLTPGVHTLTWAQLTIYFGRNLHRSRLLTGLRQAVENFAIAGCDEILLDGSFVTEKEYPSDFDACWKEDRVNFTLLDPLFIDLYDLRTGRLRQKAAYSGEFFPMNAVANPITGVTYREFFQRDKHARAKGIVRLEPQGL